jgi:hypothetical protein
VAQQIGGLRLLPTPSLNHDVLEYGLIVQDETGIIFNQVDTFLTADTIQRLHREVGQLDVHLAMYASQHFDLFESKRANTALLHGINLHTASRLAAGCVVPAAAGFRFSDDLGWLNRHVFPISPARFVQDLRQVSPMLRIVEVHPGDTLVIAQGQVDVQRQAVAYVTMLEDDAHRIAYDASAPIPALEDCNPAGYGLQGLREFAQGVVEVGLPQSLARGIATQEQVTMQYLRHGVVYQVTVVFPDGVHRCWTYRFDRQRQTVQRAPDDVVPDVRKCITASALVDFCLGRRSYFAVRTQSRRSVQVYEVAQTAHGVVAQEVELPDLLTHYILNEMAGAERRGRDWIDWVTKGL